MIISHHIFIINPSIIQVQYIQLFPSKQESHEPQWIVFFRRSAKNPSMFHRFSHVFFGFCCEIVPSIVWSVAMKNLPSSRSTDGQESADATQRRKSPDLFFCFDQWAVAEKNGCGSCREAVACCHESENNFGACRKVHLLNYHYEV